MAQSPSANARFRNIFAAHFPMVQRYCARRLSVADANDAVSEVFLVVWRRIDDVPGGDETVPWLIGVARNSVRNVARSHRRSRRLSAKIADLPAEVDPGPEIQVVARSEYDEVGAALATLGDDDREVIRLRAWEELSVPQIAGVLGCSLSAAEKRVSRAWSRLADAVESSRRKRPRELKKGGDDRGA